MSASSPTLWGLLALCLNFYRLTSGIPTPPSFRLNHHCSTTNNAILASFSIARVHEPQLVVRLCDLRPIGVLLVRCFPVACVAWRCRLDGGRRSEQRKVKASTKRGRANGGKSGVDKRSSESLTGRGLLSCHVNGQRHVTS